MNETAFPRACCNKIFLPKSLFWKIIGILIPIVIIAFGVVTKMSLSMSVANTEKIEANSEKIKIVERLDERTLNMQKQLDRIESKLP